MKTLAGFTFALISFTAFGTLCVMAGVMSPWWMLLFGAGWLALLGMEAVGDD